MVELWVSESFIGSNSIVKPNKINVLEFFYEYVTEDDWLDGLDSYQGGKVSQVKNYDGLITGVVLGVGMKKLEVRLKIHPNGKCVQWMECTCPKNRSQNRYCEHMVALMIHIDRELPNLLANLDTRLPMRPPVKVRKKRTLADELKNNQEENTQEIASTKENAGAAEKILDHLKGSIHSVHLIAHGPTLRVRLEIKTGQLTHYDLDLDSAPKFLLANPDLKVASSEVLKLKVENKAVILGTKISETESEKITVERVVAIPVNQSSESENFVLRNHVGAEDEHRSFEFIPIKNASKTLGKEFFFLQDRGYWPIQNSLIKTEWHELPLKKVFKEDQAAELAKSNFIEFNQFGPIFLEKHLSQSVVREASTIREIQVQDDIKNGWFKLDPIYDFVDGSKISLALLMKHYREKRRKFVKAGSSWIKIPEFVTENEWRLDESGEFIEVDALGLMRLKASVGDFDHFVGSKTVLNQIRSRTEFTPEVDPPSLTHTKLELRGYQLNGLKWLLWLHKNNLHGLLADEMGLGKTHQAMGVLSSIQIENQKQQRPSKFLVVCPTTVLDHWEDKVKDFCPNLNPIKHHGAKRSQISDADFNQHSLVITSYGILMRDIRYFSRINFDVLILDEAHFAKNNDTATYQAVCKIPAIMRVCLTGTPMENHLGELKNIFDFLLPGYFGSNEYFKKNYISPIINHQSKEKELELQKMILPFKMRRTKANVLQELPAKVEDIRHCTLSDEQVVMYKQVLSQKANSLISQLKDEKNPIPYMHVFATLTLLKQICNHPALVDKVSDWRTLQSGKFELLKELLREALDSNHKVVIFSQYVSMLKIIQEYLESERVDHAVLTGHTKNRGQVIKKFQEDENCKVFCGSLLAGGIGIDLTAASVVIHYDRWWNASKENQATDRVHRFGQNKNVQVIKLITRGTLEEKIDLMIRRKQDLFEKFMDRDEELFKNFSRQELIELLQS